MAIGRSEQTHSADSFRSGFSYYYSHVAASVVIKRYPSAPRANRRVSQKRDYYGRYLPAIETNEHYFGKNAQKVILGSGGN